MYGGVYMKRLKYSLLPFMLGVAVIYTFFVAGYRYQKSVEAANFANAPVTFVIDAGHGGEDGGAVSISGKLESSFNLAIAQNLDTLMAFCGYNTVMIRDGDYSIYDPSASSIAQKKVSDLKNRVAKVNETPNAILLSIHQNQFPQEKYHGAQVFYGKQAGSKELADRVQTTIREGLDPSNNRKIKPADKVYLMENINCPGILVECGFLSNRDEEQKLLTPAYQTKLAMTICFGTLAQLNEESGDDEI